MDENQQEKSESNILKQEDISQIIKHFSFVIQQRFEEIQKNYNYFTCLNSINYDRSELQKDTLYKYAQYKTSDQHQIKLLQKFVQRLLQIFEFFRQKTDDPQILQQMSQKIHQKFHQILKNQTNCHFFVNNRPKTHTINVKPLQSRSTSNDFLSIVGPGNKKSDKQHDPLISNSQKSRTQTPQKRVIEVGKLFKYVFSVLKRGYLIKLRMQKPEKKHKTFNKQNSLKVDENTATISVQGTCAILRNCSQKSNKENNENYGGRILTFCRDKLSINPLNVMSQNRKQFQITQKIKNRSISTNQYSFMSSQNPSMLKNSTGKTRQLDRKVNLIYDILNVQKYSIMKVVKQPEACKKDQLKRNVWIENECKKFMVNYERWSCKEKQKFTHQKDKNQLTQKKCQLKQQQSEQPINEFVSQRDESKTHGEEHTNDIISNPNKMKQSSDYESDSGEHQGIFLRENDFCFNEKDKQRTFQRLVPLKIDFKTEENQYFQSELTSTQNGRDAKNHTILTFTSRPPSKQAINVLTDKPPNFIDKLSHFIDKPSNFNDKTSNLIDHKHNKNLNESPAFKSRSNSHQQKKALRLNLPIMLSDKSNYLNQTDLRIQNKMPQKSNKLSQKSQFYLQNYHVDCNDDGIFVPLLPKKDSNNENNRQNRNNFSVKKNNLSVKKNNLMANFHPLNRCRLFREKKIVRNSMMVPLMEYKNNNNTDLSLMNGRVKNAIF